MFAANKSLFPENIGVPPAGYRLKIKILLLMPLFLLIISSELWAQEIGHIAALKGTVIIKRGSRTIKAAINDKLFLKDTVETREASRVKLLFNDDSLLTLSENSSANIKEYINKQKTKKGKFTLNLMDGQVRALSGRNKLEIHSPTAVAGVRGTFFSVWVSYEDGLPVVNIAVLDGEVDVSNIKADIPGSVILEKGKMTKIYQNKPPSPPAPIPPEVEDKILDCTP